MTIERAEGSIERGDPGDPVTVVNPVPPPGPDVVPGDSVTVVSSVPPPGADVVEEEAGVRVVSESERAQVEPDGTVSRRYQRVEQEAVQRRDRAPWYVWAILALLALIIGALAWWYFTRGETKNVPSVTGVPVATAVARLQDEGFKSGITSLPHPEQAGIVFAQSPVAGTDLKKGSTVEISVSKGSGTVAVVAVPNAVGMSETEARNAIVAAGFQVTEVRVASTQPAGTVLAQNPLAGGSLVKGATIRINVSKGTGTQTVPNAVGLSDASARSGIVGAGFRVTEVRVASTQPAGTVVAQNPAAGGNAPKGSSVRINVSSGAVPAGTGTQPAASTPTTTTAATQPTTTTTTPTTTTSTQPTSASVPALSGDVQTAAQALSRAGLLASIHYVPGTDPLGTVENQSPVAGKTAPAGSHVTINVSSGPGQKTQETVPDAANQTIPQAVQTMNQAGLRLILLKKDVSDQSLAGKVVEQTPVAGSNAPKNAQVLVYMGAYKP
jgi:beta-lactam-binding protein with PASTA domain